MLKFEFLRKIFIIIALFLSNLLVGFCQSNLSKVFFIEIEGQKKIKYITKIPSGYIYTTDHIEVEKDCTHEYWYQDSSVFYISSRICNLNYNNKVRDSLFINDFIAYCSNDTLTVSGVNNKGLYWKNYRLKSICFGYNNANLYQKKIFDKAIENLYLRYLHFGIRIPPVRLRLYLSRKYQ